jgi:hypothetical protein
LGEYELVFSVPEKNASRFLSALGDVGNVPILVGEVVDAEGLWFAQGQRCVSVDWSSLPEPRLLSPNDYLQELTNRVRALRAKLEGVSI